uniref:Uncharacterized protein n=1 Tax=Panagrolaimus davidi TaxID=227884 RepID=A0A914QE08_9BILA
MPAFTNYSLEELRFAFQKATDIKETYKFIYNQQTGFFAIDWKPKKPGRFRIDCTIDGFKLGSTTFIEVNERRTPSLSPRSIFQQNDAIEKEEKVKKAFCDPLSPFIGVRIRAHPSLSAPAIGTISRGCSITWDEWIKNADGTWLKLTEEARVLFGDKNNGQVAWCLQYHKAFEKTLLIVDEKDLMDPKKPESETPVEMLKPLKSPRRMLPPIPPKPKTFKTELTEDADILTVNRASTQASSTSSSPHEALSPRLMDCCRSVFAALVWHERLSADLITCANHLKSSSQIEQLFYDLQNPALPTCFPQIIKLYRSSVQCVLEIVEQHLILPSPPSMKQLSSRQMFLQPSDEICELCHELHPKPITVHMREKHPGCAGPCGGHGYNSIGNYTTGWTGLCGDGGKSNAVWYLMCPSCRTTYLNKAAAEGKKNQVHAILKVYQTFGSLTFKTQKMPFQKDDANDWTKFRQKAVSKQFCAETILKENALFLLDLRPCEDASRLPIRLTPKKVAHTYKINLYPQGSAIPQKEPSTDDALLVDTDLVNNISLSPLHHVSHQSDPGKQQTDLSAIGEGDPFSLSASANLFRRPQVPLSLPPLPQRLTSLNGIHELLRHPVLLFCVETHNLQSLRRYFYHSISRGTKFAYAFRVWNWLLKLVTSETIVTDIVWNYLTTLGSYSSYNHWLNMDLKFATKLKLLPHPWRLCYLAGTDVSGAMIDEMHSFLGTLAVILQSPGVDMSLKCLCFKAWTFHLTLHERVCYDWSFTKSKF